MEQLPEFASGGVAGTLGVVGGTIVAAFFYLRRMLSSDNAQTDTIDRYKALLEGERAERVRLNEQMRARDIEWREAMNTMADLRAEVAGLRQQVAYQSRTIDRLSRQLGEPTSNDYPGKEQ